jgi:CheY-like chemotaxis protein
MSTCALIVEDNAATREALALLLEAAGHAVATATDGRQALDYLRAHQPPCLVLLDLMMPVMDGWQFLEERRRDPALAVIPVVLFTAADSVGPAYARRLGAEAVIHKPAEPDALLDVVGRYC